VKKVKKFVAKEKAKKTAAEAKLIKEE